MSVAPDLPRLSRAVAVSFGLACAGALVTVALAAVLAFGGRERPLGQAVGQPRLRGAGRGAGGGPAGAREPGLARPRRGGRRRGGEPRAAGPGLCRPADGLGAAADRGGLARVTPSMDRAARSLGETTGGAMRRVHAPLARGALWTAALLVFVDVLKELPATLMLRPVRLRHPGGARRPLCRRRAPRPGRLALAADRAGGDRPDHIPVAQGDGLAPGRPWMSPRQAPPSKSSEVRRVYGRTAAVDGACAGAASPDGSPACSAPRAAARAPCCA